MRQTMLFLWRWVGMLIVAVLLVTVEEPVFLHAQAGSSELKTANEVNIRDAVEVLRERRLVEELQLSESRAKVVIEKMRYARNLKKDYQLQQYRLENELAELFSIVEHDDAKIATVLQNLKDAKFRYYQELLRNDEEFHQLLTPEEQAKYVLFQRVFNQKLKDAIVSIRKQDAQKSSNPSQILRNQESESVIRQSR